METIMIADADISLDLFCNFRACKGIFVRNEIIYCTNLLNILILKALR